MHPLILFLVFIFPFSSTAAAFFVWPSDWVVINNSSLPSTDPNLFNFTTMDGPFRAIVASSGKVVFSENLTYCFGFIDLNSSGAFTLSVAMAVGRYRTAPGMEIWSANRNRPVGENAVLKIGPAGNMVLQDWDGTEVWNSGDGTVKAIEMQEYGQLEFFNTTNATVWRSWLYPTHTLVQGQVFDTGSRLVSNTSVGNTTEGMYSLVMEPGGMVLYTGTGSSSQPYWAEGFPGLDYESIREPCFYNASSDVATSAAVYAGQDLEINYLGTPENASRSCPVNQSTSVSLPFSSSFDVPASQFLRLDDDGNLRAYKISNDPLYATTQVWAVDYELFRSGSAAECRLPNVCGRYGVCSEGLCSCPGSGSADAFAQLDSLDARSGCKPPRPLVCEEGNQSSSDHHFLALQGVDYFANSNSTPEPVSTLEDCKSLCSSNCSCQAFFFRSDSSSCFQARDLMSLLAVPNNTFKAYLKVQNASVIASPTVPSSQASNALHKATIAGIAVGAAAAILIICSSLVLLILRRKHDSPDFMDPDDEEEAAFFEALPGLPPRFSLKELQLATEGFKKKLGAGGFGSVYEGVLKDGSKVAVKKLDGARQGHKEFRAEVATIGSISHVNLIQLRGFCAEKGERLLIYELVENGSLDKWIFKDKTRTTEEAELDVRFLSWERRFSVAMGTAKGLAYLHEDCREPVIHLDIKPQNILVDESFVPKVADFGMARLMDRDMTEVVTAVRGTPGYLAPEWLRASIATKKCDVYSFGMVLLELIGGRRNFDPTLGTDPSLFYFPTWAKLRALEGRYMELLDERMKDSVDEAAAVRVIKVAFWCIQEDARKRPRMGNVVKMLEGEDAIPDPPLCLAGLPDLGVSEVQGTMLSGDAWAFSTATISHNQVSGPR